MTLTRMSEDVWGRTRVVNYEIAGDASYATGGSAILPADVGLKTIQGVQQIGTKTAGVTYTVVYDYEAGKLVWYVNGAQVSNATDISLKIVKLRFYGSH